MTPGEGGSDFEPALKQDLPRCTIKQARTSGRDRGLTSHWLQPDEIVGRPAKGCVADHRRRPGGRLLAYHGPRQVQMLKPPALPGFSYPNCSYF